MIRLSGTIGDHQFAQPPMQYRYRVPPDLAAIVSDHRHLSKRTVYKYVHSEHLPAILGRGSIKIGSLSSFSKLENDFLRDQQEGTNSTSIGEQAISFSEVHPASVARQVFRTAGEGDMSISGLTLQVAFDYPTFCFVYENNYGVYKSLSDPKKPFDSVIEISDIRAVAEIVAGHIAKTNPKRSVSYLYLPVIYRDVVRRPVEASPRNLCRAFEKPLPFSENREGRLIFLNGAAPDSSAIQSGAVAIIELPELRKYFRRVALPA